MQRQHYELYQQHAALQHQYVVMQRQHANHADHLHRQSQEIQRHHSLQINQMEQIHSQAQHQHSIQNDEMQRQNNMIQSQLNEYLPPADLKCPGISYAYLQDDTRQSENKDKTLNGWHNVVGDTKRYRANYEEEHHGKWPYPRSVVGIVMDKQRSSDNETPLWYCYETQDGSYVFKHHTCVDYNMKDV